MGTGAAMACIEFDATFESGNLDSAKLVAELPLEYDLHIRSDTLNARHRVWFFFSARSSVRGGRSYPDSAEGSTQAIDARDQGLFEDF